MNFPIDLFAYESATSSFIIDVLSSLNYVVEFHQKFVQKNYGALVIWDSSSFPHETEKALFKIKEANPNALILVIGNSLENVQNVQNIFDTFLPTEKVKIQLMSEIGKLKEIYEARKIFREKMSHLVGNSASMQLLRKNVERTMIHSGPVLIQGESGVGKELVAQAIACFYSKFVTVNCSAIPETLFESELFGHTRGAFTGAQNERIGLFEEANNGAIFLDEIGDMPLHAQVKLLRVIQNQEIRPIGSNKIKRINVRIIAATNRDLRKAIKQKTFREDLYYRLNVIPLELLPLRKRKEDIEDLANYFIKIYSRENTFYTLTKSALERLKKHSWPGNIRELENVIQRTLLFAGSSLIEDSDIRFDETLEHFEDEILSYSDFRNHQLEEEREFLRRKIFENHGSISETAQQLGMIRTALYNRLNRLGLDVKDVK